MEPERRKRLLLAALGIIVVVFLAYQLWPRTSGAVAPASNRRGTPNQSARAPETGITAPEVHLGALEGQRPKPSDTERNLFRFKPKPPPPPPPAPPRPVEAAPPPVAVAPPPPPPPPIPLKFIGIVEGEGKKIAVLRDDRGVYRGVEGEAVLGQYVILKIGTESIEMSYLDGRGRQTIRLTGGS